MAKTAEPVQKKAFVRITRGQDVGKEFPITKQAMLGRKPTSQGGVQAVLVRDKEVSRNHARIVIHGAHHLIEDLNSTNGTFVDDKRLVPNQPTRLKGGEEIAVGGTRLLFYLRAPSRVAQGAAWYNAIASTIRDKEEAQADNQESISLRIVQDAQQPPPLNRVIDASKSFIALAAQHKDIEDSGIQNLLNRLQAISEISVALGTVTEREQLMQKIVESIFDVFPGAERAFVMLHNADTMELLPVAARHRDGDSNIEECAISSTVVNEVISKKRAILSVNAMDDERFNAQQSIIDFSIRALMCAPLLVGDEVLGLIQVDSESSKHRFDEQDLQVLSGLGTQAAIAVKNTQLYTDIERLFEGFINASVMAIESRDPATAGHSFRVADYTEQLAQAVDHSGDAKVKHVQFRPDELEELRYAALLHDFGKVGVRERVLTKSKKLHREQMALLRERFRYARANIERHGYRQLIDEHINAQFSHIEFLTKRGEIDAEIARQTDQLSRFLQLVLQTNEPSVSSEVAPDALREVLDYRFATEEGKEGVLLFDFEFNDLVVDRGSLNDIERREIESHVSHTFSFLSLIPWPKKLERLPEIAFGHHEKLDGSGYPRQLKADQLPVQTRILTLTDIYDALTSGDRPYKTAVDAQRALDILAEEVANNKVDGDLFKIFCEAEIYKSTDE
jgi:3',5'-cyclic-nucleotide phosphodiesterase